MRRHYPFDTSMYPLWLVMAVAVGIWSCMTSFRAEGSGMTSSNIAGFILYAMAFYAVVLGFSSFTRYYWQINLLALFITWGFCLFVLLAWVPYTAGETTMHHIAKNWPSFAMQTVVIMLPSVLFHSLCKSAWRNMLEAPEAEAGMNQG